MNSNKTQDITKLLFPDRNLTEEEMKEAELWDEATQEAYRLVGDESPIRLLQKTKELYQGLLAKEGIEYKE